MKPQPAGRPKVFKKKDAVPKKRKRRLAFLIGSIVILVVAVLFCFSRSFHAKFTDWDDTDYVLENNLVQKISGDNVGKMFTESSATNYHPLTMLSLAIDYHRAAIDPNTKEPDPSPFHQTNIFLHLFNVLLMFVFIYSLSNKKWYVAFIVAFLFGVHPMHVESVAWIAGRKDLLYTFFFLASLIAYLHYCRTRSWLLYCISFLLFLFSTLSKPAAAPMAFILFLVDYYQNRLNFQFSKPITYKNLFQPPGSKILLEKIPFLVVGILIMVITFMIQKPIAVIEYERFTILQRFLFSTYGFCSYLVKLVVPAGLSAFYPFPTITGGWVLPSSYYLSFLFTLFIFGFVLWSEKKSKLFTFGIFFYLFMLILVLQFVSIGQTILADRYTYLPYAAIFFIIAESYSLLWTTKRIVPGIWKYAATAVLLIFMTLNLIAGYNRTEVWQNSDNLWTDVLNKYPDAIYPRKARATHYLKNNRTAEALKDYEKLSGMNVKDKEVFNYLGYIYSMNGNHKKAVSAIEKAIQLDSNNSEYYYNCGISLGKMNMYPQAIAHYTHAIAKNPNYDMAYLNRGVLYGETGQTDKSIADFDYLIKTHPGSDEYILRRGFLKMQKKLFAEALGDFNECARINPKDPRGMWFAGVCYFNLQDIPNARLNLQKANTMGFCPDQHLLQQAIGNGQWAIGNRK
ncbi:MAG: tetratricopeptide repeat protein [Bacteroidetes bacterium]|nr:tetratricopeptide repeat protein [Bacteroidota bacterium]